MLLSYGLYAALTLTSPRADAIASAMLTTVVITDMYLQTFNTFRLDIFLHRGKERVYLDNTLFKENIN